MKWLRIELPGGYVRVVNEVTYQKLVSGMQLLAKALENAEYVPEPKTETVSFVHRGNLWRSFLSSEQAHAWKARKPNNG